jgi:hypothetical protein
VRVIATRGRLMKQLKIHPSARLRNLINTAPNKPNINDADNYAKFANEGLPATIQINRTIDRYCELLYVSICEVIEELDEETLHYVLNAECVDAVKTSPKSFIDGILEVAHLDEMYDVADSLSALSCAHIHALTELDERFWHHRIDNIGEDLTQQLFNVARTVVESPFLDADIEKEWQFTGLVDDSDTVIAVTHSPGNLANLGESHRDIICASNWILNPEIDLDEIEQYDDFQLLPGAYRIAGYEGAYACYSRQEWDEQDLNDNEDVYFVITFVHDEVEYVLGLLDLLQQDSAQNRTAEIDAKICETIIASKAWLF